MATTTQLPTHIHALPRHTSATQVYPEAVPVYDVASKRIRIGDGTTAGGIEIPNKTDLDAKADNTAVAALAERMTDAETALGDLHAHENKMLLDKFSFSGGKLYYDGNEIRFVAASGDVTLIGANTHVLEWTAGESHSLGLGIVASNGAAVSYAVTHGTLPAGLTLTNGVIGGVPSVAGSSLVIITASGGGVSMLISVTFNISQAQIVLAGTTSYTAEYAAEKDLDIEFDMTSSGGNSVAYALQEASGTLAIENGRLTGNPQGSTSSSVITVIASAGGASETIHVTAYNLDRSSEYGTPQATDYLTLIAPEDLSLYAGESAEGHYWSDDDVLTLRIYNAADTCVFDSGITPCNAFNGTEIETVNRFHYLHAGHRVMVGMIGVAHGALTVRWARGGTVKKTGSVTWDGLRHEMYFQRPAGVGSWQLKVGDAVTPALAAKVYALGQWIDWPAGGLGPEYAYHPVCLQNAVPMTALACWQSAGGDGQPFWYMT